MKILSHTFNRSRYLLWLLFFILMMMPFMTMMAQKAPEVISLYQGKAPGSENWDWEEGETSKTTHGFRVAYNVSRPTLTVFRPEIPNGAAVLLFPGGGSNVVNIENEGELLARELAKKGVTAFVLKYRTGRSTSADPWNEMMANMRDTALFRRNLEALRPLVNADANAAIRYVRSHATGFKIDPARVGVLGFSAGGSLALRLCMSEDKNARPDFAGLIYSVYRPAEGDTLPSTIPPAFIACASDDVLASSLNSITLYTAWIKTKRPAELHIYSKGGHGLRGSAPARDWLKRFEEWMVEMGMVK